MNNYNTFSSPDDFNFLIVFNRRSLTPIFVAIADAVQADSHKSRTANSFFFANNCKRKTTSDGVTFVDELISSSIIS
jgi:hypothetical protein